MEAIKRLDCRASKTIICHQKECRAAKHTRVRIFYKHTNNCNEKYIARVRNLEASLSMPSI